MLCFCFFFFGFIIWIWNYAYLLFSSKVENLIILVVFVPIIVMFSLYSIVNVDLNVPYYIASLAKVIIDFPITKIWNKKYNCLFHIYMLKLNKDRMNAIHVQHYKLSSFIVLFEIRTKSIFSWVHFFIHGCCAFKTHMMHI
jgi:hypothetical protein